MRFNLQQKIDEERRAINLLNSTYLSEAESLLAEAGFRIPVQMMVNFLIRNYLLFIDHIPEHEQDDLLRIIITLKEGSTSNEVMSEGYKNGRN
jgi:hypothetical protein